MTRLRHWSRAIAVTIGLATLTWVGPAYAHDPAGQQLPDAEHYSSTITGGLPGEEVGVALEPHGEWIELAYSGNGTVLVRGYFDEPYLKITREGVWRNSLSPSAALNQNLFGQTQGLDQGGVIDAPSWVQVAKAGSYRWHDHRIHWMSYERPPAAQRDPGHYHLIGDWKIPGTIDDSPFAIAGTLAWLPINDSGGGVSTALVIGAGGFGMLVAGALLGLLVVRRRQPIVR